MEKELNILKHKLVPEHIILKEEEKRIVLDKYRITEEQLPKIATNDPAVKEIGAKAGNVIKITRNSATAGESIYYRVVVK